MLLDVAPTKELESLTQLARKYSTMSMTAEYMNGFLRDLHKLSKVPTHLRFCASAVQEEDGTYTIPSKGKKISSKIFIHFFPRFSLYVRKCSSWSEMVCYGYSVDASGLKLRFVL